MAGRQKKNESTETQKFDLAKIANSCKVTEKDNYELREYTINNNIKVNHYLFDNFEKLDLIFCGVAVIKATVFESENEKYPTFPAYKNKDGKWIGTAYPFDKELISVIKKIINS